MRRDCDPVRTPCGARPALSWDYAALRGLRSDLRRAVICSAPARTAFRRPSGTCLVGRSRPDCSGGGPPCAFAPYRGPPQHTRTVPGSRRTLATDDASFPGLPCSTAHDGTADPLAGRGFRPRAYRVRGLVTSFAASTTVPSGALRRPSAHELHPSRPSPRVDRAPFRETLALVTLRTSWSPRSPVEQDGRRRLQGLDPDVELVPEPPCGSSSRCLLGVHPSRALPPPVPRERCDPLTVPHHALGGIDVPTRLRLGVFRCGRPGIAPLRAAGSPGVSYLSTVTAPRRPPRGAGVWIGCPDHAFALARTGLYAPSLHGLTGTRGPDPAPPSFGLRLLPLPVEIGRAHV